MNAPTAPFQNRVQFWMMQCFPMQVCRDTIERNHRFLEEALELVQSLGCTASEAHQLVEYVFGRPEGNEFQEVGGVMVTLAALCLAATLDMHDAGEVELARIMQPEVMDKIRAKQASKPKHSPLPEYTGTVQGPTPDAELIAELRARVTELLQFNNEFEERARVAERRLKQLEGLINSPETADWIKGVPLEAAHQVERYGVEHDAGKSAPDWFWLIGYLSGKALAAALLGNIEKAKHHTISTGAALLNWHRNLTGENTAMRPGIMPPAAE